MEEKEVIRINDLIHTISCELGAQMSKTSSFLYKFILDQDNHIYLPLWTPLGGLQIERPKGYNQLSSGILIPKDLGRELKRRDYKTYSGQQGPYFISGETDDIKSLIHELDF